MGNWIAFWDSDHSIYVSKRHREAHARRLAADLAAYIPSPRATMLDYGCGEALYADWLPVARLILVEVAPRLRAKLQARYVANARIEVAAPEAIGNLPAGSVDFALINSVTQYLSRAELDDVLALIHPLLHPGGVLVIGDVLRPGVSGMTDALALLRFSLAEGFFLAALRGLARTMLSDYLRLRRDLGLARYGEPEMTQKLRQAGFAARRAASNLGHNQARMTFVGEPIAEPAR